MRTSKPLHRRDLMGESWRTARWLANLVNESSGPHCTNQLTQHWPETNSSCSPNYKFVSKKNCGCYFIHLMWGQFQFSQFSQSGMFDSVTPWTTARQASLSITNSQSLPKLMSIMSVMPSNHLILSRPLLLLPSIFPGIRVFSDELALCIRWPKYWSFSFNIIYKYRILNILW